MSLIHLMSNTGLGLVAVGDFVGTALKFESLRRCWQHSLAGAMLSEKLARACQMDPDVAYLAALLRDIGRLRCW